MPLPASVPTGTVSGTWYTPSGSLAVGEIIFLLTHEIEIPDDADGVVIPVRYEVSVPAGQLNVTLPAGFYNTFVSLNDGYRKPKLIEVVASANVNLPDAIGVVPPEDLLTPVRSVNGVLPDSTGNITIVGGGSVASVFGRSGAVVAQSGDYTKAQVGLGNVDNTSDIAKPISTATQTALDGKDAAGSASSAVSAHVAAPDPHPQYALESALVPPVKAFGTTGKLQATFGPGDTSGSWTVAPAQWRVTVPAAVGDVLFLNPSIIAQVTADAEMDVCSLNGNTPIRYYSSGTTTQGPNGHGGLYMGTQFSNKMGNVKWVVTANDIVGGNVTLSYMYRAGSGVTWGSGAYPNEITLTNEGAP